MPTQTCAEKARSAVHIYAVCKERLRADRSKGAQMSIDEESEAEVEVENVEEESDNEL
jgi:hypothetical protein